MQKTISIKQNREFHRLYRSGKSICSDVLVIYFKKNNLNINRLGITVTKKVGKAVVRNKVRRRIKESYMKAEPGINGFYDIIVVARNKAAYSDFKKIKSALFYLLGKAKIFDYEKNTYFDN